MPCGVIGTARFSAGWYKQRDELMRSTRMRAPTLSPNTKLMSGFDFFDLLNGKFPVALANGNPT